MLVALAGGVGAARFLRGLVRVVPPEDVTAIVNTADDAQQPIETVTYPGPDQILGTTDDQTVSLRDYTREIRIRDVETDLRSITVIVTYKVGQVTRSYSLTTYISNYA